MNTRRKLLVLLGAAACVPLASFAQPKQPVLIGWLNESSRETHGNRLVALKEGLTALGWKEGSQFVIEEYWADGKRARTPALAQELLAKKPAVIVAGGVGAAVVVARLAPPTPIVMGTGGDPVAAGVAASLARPGGLVTGVTNLTDEVTEKYIELLLAAAPKLRRIGILYQSSSPAYKPILQAVRRSATQYSVEAHFADVANAEEILPAIAKLAKEGAQALVVMQTPMFQTERRQIVKLALERRWPVVGGTRELVEEGALLGYGVETLENFRRAAVFVDKILKGAKPGDLPIEQPTKLQLSVNQKTAKALGLKIPNSILMRTDKVIE